MPNRILKEAIKYSADIDRLSWFEEVTFYRILVTADDYGRLDGRTVVLKNSLFPTKENLTKKCVEDAIASLEQKGMLRRYEVDGEPLLYIPAWELHQQIRAKKSKFPPPEEEDCKKDNSCNQMISDETICTRNPIQNESESISESESESTQTCSPPGRQDAFHLFAGQNKSLGTALKGFDEMRKKIKKPMTERAKQMLLDKLQSLSREPEEQVRILDQSVVHCWQEVYPLHREPEGHTTHNPFIDMMEAEK